MEAIKKDSNAINYVSESIKNNSRLVSQEIQKIEEIKIQDELNIQQSTNSNQYILNKFNEIKIKIENKTLSDYTLIQKNIY